MVYYQCCWLSGQGGNSFPDSAWGSRSERQQTAAQEVRNSKDLSQSVCFIRKAQETQQHMDDEDDGGDDEIGSWPSWG